MADGIPSLPTTPEERAAGALRSPTLASAVAALRGDGVVVLRDVVADDHLRVLRERMLADLPVILAREDAPYNFNAGNVQHDPPPFPPYLFRDVLLNDLVIQVTSAVLGPGVTNSYYSGNTALPGGRRQPVHPDVGQLWPDLSVATPAFGLVVNVPVEVTPENGSTELWPGTHLYLTYSVRDGSARVPETALARWRSERPPVQPVVPLGSVVIRDLRLWHAGMPNHTSEPRPMIAMIHWSGWWRSAEAVPFAAGSEAFFEHPVLKTNARFVDGPIDYLRHNRAYDFQP
jgi:hypothetical protein